MITEPNKLRKIIGSWLEVGKDKLIDSIIAGYGWRSTFEAEFIEQYKTAQSKVAI